MSNVLQSKPAAVAVKTGVADPKAVATALADVLADTYSLTIKTHAVHWNVEGPMFYAVHKLTETQYEELFAATDVIAERIRALGQLTPTSATAMLAGSVVDELKNATDAPSMCEGLAEDHSKVAKRLHKVIAASDDAGDPVTADMCTARAAFHEQAAWMLRALAK